MSCYSLLHLNSVSELRAAGVDWDNLWLRSDVHAPTARAELIAQWVERFSPDADFHALIVKDGKRWIAAIPLLQKDIARVLNSRILPVNPWVPAGGMFLLDPDCDMNSLFEVLFQGIRELPCQWLWLDEVAVDAPHWKCLLNSLRQLGIPTNVHRRYRVGYFETTGNWEEYLASWSQRHRRNVRRGARDLARKGQVDFELMSQISPEKVESLLHQGFEIENRSWKGQGGSSVFGRGQFSFFVQQARQLADWGQLELAFLRCDGIPIAFMYGMRAKGIGHTFKIAFDPVFSAFSPGQLLFHNIFKHSYDDPNTHAVDSVGEMTDTMAKWRPVPYDIGTVVIAPHRLLGRLTWYLYDRCWPYARQLKCSLVNSFGSPKKEVR